DSLRAEAELLSRGKPETLIRLTASPCRAQASRPLPEGEGSIPLVHEGARKAQLTHHRLFLDLMSFHSLQDVIQSLHGTQNMRAFVEHDGLRPMPHRGIGDFRAGRNSLLCKVFENLRCPNDRTMRRLANPQNFFLNLCHSLKSTLDGEVAASDHDAE